MDLAHESLVAGRYRLDSPVGRGGMGAVWSARDEKLGRQVAVKLMSPDFVSDPSSRERFEREALAAARLASHHIVEVHDYGSEDGVPFIVMELLAGESLGRRLKRRGRLRIDEAAPIVVQICKGLKAAHHASLIHRDLKPGNIFISQRDDAETIKLLDFGVVKALGAKTPTSHTETGTVLGTPQYMSPEQTRARPIDARSDLWSVAVIAYRMLSGTNPFNAGSTADIVLKLCRDPVPSIRSYADDLPPSLDGFFQKALARDPNARYQSAATLALAFANACNQTGSAAVSLPNLGDSASWPSRSTDRGAPVLSPTPLLSPTPHSTSVVTAAPSTMVLGTKRRDRTVGVLIGTCFTLAVMVVAAVIWVSTTGEAQPSGAEAVGQAASTRAPSAGAADVAASPASDVDDAASAAASHEPPAPSAASSHSPAPKPPAPRQVRKAPRNKRTAPRRRQGTAPRPQPPANNTPTW